MKLPSNDGIKRKQVVESSDAHGPQPDDQVKTFGKQDINPRTNRAVETTGNAGVKTPWQNSHQIVKGSEPYWGTHHKNSQGLDGQTTWENKGAKRGDKEGPQQRQNPYWGINSERTDKLNQSY